MVTYRKEQTATTRGRKGQSTVVAEEGGNFIWWEEIRKGFLAKVTSEMGSDMGVD